MPRGMAKFSKRKQSKKEGEKQQIVIGSSAFKMMPDILSFY